MKILLLIIVSVLIIGCTTNTRNPPLNNDRFEDYVPWWITNRVDGFKDRGTNWVTNGIDNIKHEDNIYVFNR